MGGIGDYVHLYAKNYITHGTSKNGKSENFENAYKKQKEAIKLRFQDTNKFPEIQKADKLKLQETIEQIFLGGRNENETLNVTEIRKKIDEEMLRLFGSKLQQIDYNTGNVLSKEGVNLKNTIGKAQSSINVKDMLDRIKRLQDNLALQLSDGKLSLEKYDKIKAEINALEKEYKKGVRKFLEKGVHIDKVESIARGASSELATYKNQLNEYIQKYAACPAVALQKGTLFEYVVAYAPMVAESVANEAVGKVVGGKTEDVSFDSSKFADKYITRELGEGVIEKTDAKSSQGKVDVELSWLNQDLRISAKNIQFKDNFLVHLMSNSSLLYLLQNADTSFANHALNILSTHPKTSKDAAETAALNEIKQNKHTALRTLKLVVFYTALTGDINGRKSVNTFIINDNSSSSKGKVKVLSIPEIANKVISEAESQILSSDNVITCSGLAIGHFKSFQNNQANSSQQRISSLLTDVHSRKLTMSLNLVGGGIKPS